MDVGVRVPLQGSESDIDDLGLGGFLRKREARFTVSHTERNGDEKCMRTKRGKVKKKLRTAEGLGSPLRGSQTR